MQARSLERVFVGAEAHELELVARLADARRQRIGAIIAGVRISTSTGAIVAIALLGGCASASKPVPSSRSTTEMSETSSARSHTPIPFDDDAAKRSLDATDITSCQALPPFADEPVPLRIAFARDGHVKSLIVGGPFGGTPFGECVRERYQRLVRVPSFDEGPAAFEARIARGPVRRDETMKRFDAASVRSVVHKANLAECAQTGGEATKRRVTLVIMPTGQPESVTVEGDFDARAICIERVLKRLEFRPYSGVPGTEVTVDLEIPARAP